MSYHQYSMSVASGYSLDMNFPIGEFLYDVSGSWPPMGHSSNAAAGFGVIIGVPGAVFNAAAGFGVIIGVSGELFGYVWLGGATLWLHSAVPKIPNAFNPSLGSSTGSWCTVSSSSVSNSVSNSSSFSSTGSKNGVPCK